jgi:hypothetical protein
MAKRSVGSKPKRKLRKGRLTMVIVILFAIAAIFLLPSFISKISSSKSEAYGRVKVDRYKDFNDKHLSYAKKLGIKPFKTEKAYREGKDDLLSSGDLRKISSNRFYVVNKLGHSHPYLVPKAAKLLEDIGKRFNEKLDDAGKDKYFFRVSSLLRTGESQKSLSRNNMNAASASSHLYGTTFDIAYKNVVKKPFPWIKKDVADASVIKLLSEAIGELRKEGRCLVVTEYKEKCFHITVMN